MAHVTQHRRDYSQRPKVQVRKPRVNVLMWLNVPAVALAVVGYALPHGLGSTGQDLVSLAGLLGVVGFFGLGFFVIEFISGWQTVSDPPFDAAMMRDGRNEIEHGEEV